MKLEMVEIEMILDMVEVVFEVIMVAMTAQS